MNDIYVTFHGWVGGEVDLPRPERRSACATSGWARTPRLKRKGDVGGRRDTWYTVNCWRASADNVRDSVSKGDAVDRARPGAQRDAGSARTASSHRDLIVEASFVGHDLNRGTSSFTKRPAPSAPTATCTRRSGHGAPRSDDRTGRQLGRPARGGARPSPAA